MGSMGGLSGPGFWGEEGAGCCPAWELAPPGASWPAEPLPRHGPFLTTHPLPLSSGLACRRLWAALPPAVSRDDPLCVCPPTPQGLAPRWSAPRPALPAPLATATPSVPVPLASPRAQLHRAGLWAEGRGAAGGRGRLYLWLLSPPARTAPLASSALPVALAGLPPPPQRPLRPGHVRSQACRLRLQVSGNVLHPWELGHRPRAGAEPSGLGQAGSLPGSVASVLPCPVGWG